MLSVKGKTGNWNDWHIGETLHIPEGRVITIQMNGHELEQVLNAFKSYGIDYVYPSDERVRSI